MVKWLTWANVALLYDGHIYEIRIIAGKEGPLKIKFVDDHKILLPPIKTSAVKGRSRRVSKTPQTSKAIWFLVSIIHDDGIKPYALVKTGRDKEELCKVQIITIKI